MAAKTLRHILVDHSRGRLAEKRGGRQLRLSLTAANGSLQPCHEDILELDHTIHWPERVAVYAGSKA
jgi:hypothetical protein